MSKIITFLKSLYYSKKDKEHGYCPICGSYVHNRNSKLIWNGIQYTCPFCETTWKCK